jgi:L-ribulose-5-phosphate 3-epimerase
MIQNRRKFISTLVAGGIAVPLFSDFKSLKITNISSDFSIRLFSKPLDSYDFDFMCDCVAEAGIEGLDLTVRPGGRVEPSMVESKLPELIGRAHKHSLETDMIVTGITSASDPNTEKILATASGNGVKYYRLGWFEYDKNRGVWETLQKLRIVLTDIANLNRKYKIHGGYQNHSGNLVGGSVWDLYELLHDIPKEYTGSQYDVRHAMVEGASTWTTGMRLISPFINSLAIKDFTWKNIDGKLQPVSVPLGDGMVDWDQFFGILKDQNIKVPITLHIEYPLLEHDENKLQLLQQQELIVKKLKKDTAFIRNYITKYQLSTNKLQ